MSVDPQVARLLAARLRARSSETGPREPLTEGEREVLGLVEKGLSNKVIAAWAIEHKLA